MDQSSYSIPEKASSFTCNDLPKSQYRERRTQLEKDVKQRNQAVLDHLGLAHHAARQLAGRGSGEFDDLVQEARLGLLLAMEKFDPDRGFRVSSYGMSRAKGQILHFRRDRQHSIRVPWRLRDLHARGMRLQEAQQHQGLDKLSEESLASALGVSKSRWQQAVEAHWQTQIISLDSPVSAFESQDQQKAETRIDQLGSNPEPEADQQLLWLRENLQRLEPQQQRWLDAHYIKGISLRQLSHQEGIHEAMLRRAISSSLEQLKGMRRFNAPEREHPQTRRKQSQAKQPRTSAAH